MAENRISTANFGTITKIAAGAGGTSIQGAQRKRLAEWKEPGYARNLVVRVGWLSGQGDGIVRDPSFIVSGQRPASVYSFASSTNDPVRALFLEIECGAGSQLTKFSCDVAAGSIALPPCEFARVSLVCVGAVEGIDYPVTACITEGIAPNAPAPAFTQLFLSAAGSYEHDFPIPPCARAVDAWASFLSSDTLANQALSKIELTVDGGFNYAGPLVRRDYVTPSFLPHAGPVDWAQWGNDTYSITYTQSAAFSSATVVRWYIAP